MNLAKLNKRSLACPVIVTNMFALTFISLFFICFYYTKVMAYTEKQGTINGTYVNVRTSAGTAGNTNKLTYSGSYVQLNIGDTVKIIDEATASDGAKWYKVKFNYKSIVELTGFVHSAYIDIKNTDYETDGDFEKYLDSQGFPDSYKFGLRQLHSQYPNWVFVADHLQYSWEEAVDNENLLGRSLVWYNSISSWKSLQQGAYNWETGKWTPFDGNSWVAASRELIAYCMDPRNFLDERQVFQFELLSFDANIHKLENVESLLTGTFMSNKSIENNKKYSQAFMEAAAQSKVSPYHLASRVIQEVGTTGTTGGITGDYRPATGNIYTNLYNYFNIGAYAHDGRGAVENGLIYASKTDETTLRPWDTRYKAIVGGSQFIGQGYINIGQDTLYYEKFDFIGIPYTHQYMSNIIAPKQEAAKMSNAYTTEMKNTIPLVFKIPVFKNMPNDTAQCPTGDGSPNNVLENISISGYSLTPTFSTFTTEYNLIVANGVDSVLISASAMDGQARIDGVGKKNLIVGNNEVKINVTASNGSVRTYTINIVRKNSDVPADPPTEKPTTIQPTTAKPTTSQNSTDSTAKYSTSLNILQDIYLTGINEGDTVESVRKRFSLENCSIAFYKNDGITREDGKISTGNKVVITDSSNKKIKEFTFVMYGDINGDSVIDIVDMLYMKRHILEISILNGPKSIAADINKKDGIDIVDMLHMKRHILEISKILQ